MTIRSRAKTAAKAEKAGKRKYTPDIIVVDGKDLLVGRAASVIAKQLLLGKKISLVRAEGMNIAGTEIRNKIKYLNFLRKKHTTNPKKGPFHLRSPADVFTRVVRGMLPFYTKRGKSALRRLKVYEGMPSNVTRKAAVPTIPKAERRTRLAKERRFTVLGNMCEHIGWKYHPVVKKLNAARNEKATRHYKKRAVIAAKWAECRKAANAKISKENLAILQKFGKA